MDAWNKVRDLDKFGITKTYIQHNFPIHLRPLLSTWISSQLLNDPQTFSIVGTTPRNKEAMKFISAQLKQEICLIMQKTQDEEIKKNLEEIINYFESLDPLELYGMLSECLHKEMEILQDPEVNLKRFGLHLQHWCQQVQSNSRLNGFFLQSLNDILTELDQFLIETMPSHFYEWKWHPIQDKQRRACQQEYGRFVHQFLIMAQVFKAHSQSFVFCLTEQNNLVHYQGLQIEIHRLLVCLLSNILVVDEQPEEIFRHSEKKLLTARIRLLYQGPEMVDKMVKVFLVNKEMAHKIVHELTPSQLLEWERNQPVQKKVKIKSGDIVRVQLNENGEMTAKFDQLQLMGVDHRLKNVALTDLSSIVFFIQGTIQGQDYESWCSTHPFVYTVHASQNYAAEATLFWYNSFRQKYPQTGGDPLTLSGPVTWPKVSDALNKHMKKYTTSTRNLTGSNLASIRSMIPSNSENDLIDFKEMCQKKIMNMWDGSKNDKFTFWEWFQKCLDLIKKFFQSFWNKGKIVGFIHRDEAHEILRWEKTGTMLVRFSETVADAISISFKTIHDNKIKIASVSPFTPDDLKAVSLQSRIIDTRFFLYVYSEDSVGGKRIEHKEWAFDSTNTCDTDSLSMDQSFPFEDESRMSQSDSEVIAFIIRQYIKQVAVMEIVTEGLNGDAQAVSLTTLPVASSNGAIWNSAMTSNTIKYF